jgi:hypothetical protein
MQVIGASNIIRSAAMVALRRAAMLLLGLCAVPTSLSAAPPPNHPIIGTWQLPLQDGKCIETSEFRSDGTLHVSSASSRNVTLFEIANDPAGEGHFILTVTLASSNGEPDCLGLVTPVGTHTSVYVQFLSRERFIMCVDSLHSRCFGPYQMVPQSSA